MENDKTLENLIETKQEESKPSIIKAGLIKAFGKERAERIIDNFAYKFTVDAIAMNLFSQVYVLNEKYVGGMTWEEAWKTRAAAAIGNVITGRPYGIFRDWMFKKLNVTEKSSTGRKYLADVLTFAAGQTPLYVLYMALGGADANEIMKSSVFLTFAAPLAGRPQGMVYDGVRKQFGMKTAYSEEIRK